MEEEEPNEERGKYYKSCCFQIDKEFTRYITQISISYIILSLAIYKLIVISKEDNEDKSIYMSILMMILGIYTNPTKLKRKKNTIENKNDIS